MKKSILSILTLCMIISLTSCGGNADKPVTEEDIENWSDEDLEAALLALDSDDEASDAEEQEASADAGVSYEATQEIINAAWDSGLIQIDDKLVQLPIYLNEWVDLGLDYEVDGGNKSKDYLFVNGETVSYDLMLNGETISHVSFTKETEESATLEAMNPLIEDFSVNHEPESVTMYFPGGLTFGDPYETIEEKLGKATEIDGNMTYKYGQMGIWATDMFYGINIYVNRDTQTISHFEIGKSIQETNREALTTISFEDVSNVQASTTHNVTLLWAPEYKQIPGMLADNRNADSVLNYDGNKYYMSLSIHMSAQKYASPYDYIQYGDPVFDTTDESGMSRTVYRSDSSYIIVCSTDEHILQATVIFKNMTDSSEDALTVLQDLAIEIANSVQY